MSIISLEHGHTHTHTQKKKNGDMFTIYINNSHSKFQFNQIRLYNFQLKLFDMAMTLKYDLDQ